MFFTVAEAKTLHRTLVLVVILMTYAGLVIVLLFYDVMTRRALLKNRRLDRETNADQGTNLGKSKKKAVKWELPHTSKVVNFGVPKGPTNTTTGTPTTSTPMTGTPTTVTPTTGTPTTVTPNNTATSMAALQPATTSNKAKKVQPTTGPGKKGRLYKLLKYAATTDKPLGERKEKGKKKKKKKTKPVKYGNFLQVPGAKKKKKKKEKNESLHDIVLHVPQFKPMPPK